MIAIRGSMSLEDALTDLSAHPRDFPQPECHAHGESEPLVNSAPVCLPEMSVCIFGYVEEMKWKEIVVCKY